ncbi:MAG TPA: cytochrome c-type biogenesis CcmF C-terminal domain-containing protein, partial [Candidatus Manganitrophaceae bacterium]|nr:cytochrome c-type biogenesis CcmF C-terminal domain-containing protein [Candidatus Manganitrophaceae bacterium]
SIQNLKELFLMPLVIAFMGLGIFLVAGIRNSYALAGLAVICFVGAAIFFDFAKIASFWAKRDQVSHVQGFVSAYRKNPRRMAGIITHIGVLVMMIGIIFSTIYQTEKVLIMKPGDEVQLDSYKFKMINLYGAEGVNWSGQEALFYVYRGDTMIAQLRPQKRFYTVSQTPTTETAIHQINTGHLFLTIPEVSPDGTWARVRALHNPLVLWVWYGGGIMGLGVILNIFRGGRKKAMEPRPAAASPEVVVSMPGTSREGVLQAQSTTWQAVLSRFWPGRKEV